MSLDVLVDTLSRCMKSPMHARIKQTVSHTIDQLHDYQISYKHTQVIDQAWAHLAYRSMRSAQLGIQKEFYQHQANSLYRVRHPTQDTRPTYASFTKLTESRTHYTKRFALLREDINNNHVAYEDALLCREHLRMDPYIRRKRATNTAFDTHVHMLESLLGARIDTQHTTDSLQDQVNPSYVQSAIQKALLIGSSFAAGASMSYWLF